MQINDYNKQLSEGEITQNQHRVAVGGLWEELGELQFKFMRDHAGLTSEMQMLDLGCGCFRGGVRFIPYLNSGNYYGLDCNASLVHAGLELELPRAGLSLARDHVLICDDFSASAFGKHFDRVLAISVWTHLPLNHIQRCLHSVSQVLKSGGIFYSSIFQCPEDNPLLAPCFQAEGIFSYRDHDPYHYRQADFEFLIRQLSLPLKHEWIGPWGHPRNQQMLAFHRFDI